MCLCSVEKRPRKRYDNACVAAIKPFLLYELCPSVFSCPFFSCLTQVNVGKMDSPIEKWNLIIGNLALKQVRSQGHSQRLCPLPGMQQTNSSWACHAGVVKSANAYAARLLCHPGTGNGGGIPGGRGGCCSGVDPRGEVSDEPCRAALFQQRGHGLHSLPAAG